MTKNLVAVLSFFFCLSAFAQKKITLEDGVLQQNRAFRADKMLGFQWIPNTNQYTYFGDSGRKLMTASTGNAAATELVALADLNKATGADFKGFFGIDWKDADTFVLQSGNKIYEYNRTSKTGKKAADLGDAAENATFDKTKTKVAFTEKNNLYWTDGGAKVAITDDANADVVSGQAIARNEFGIHGGIFWSPKSNLIAFYQKDQSEVADYPLLDITQTPGKLENIKYPMIGQKSEKPRVGIYNLATKQTVFIAPKGAADDYLTNVSWTPDEKYVLIAELNRGQNDMRLNLYDATSGAFVRTLIEEKASTWVEPEHAAFFPSPKSNNFVWISEKDGFNNLYYYSIEGKLIKQLTANKFILKDILGANPAGTEIYFTATGANPTNTLAYKVDLKGKQTLITKDEGTHTVAISTDGNWIFDEFSSHSIQSKSLLYDKNLKAKTLLESADKYAGYAMGTAEIKTIKAADGKTDLYTRLIKPSNFDPSKKYPVMVYVYGGPHAQMITNSYLDGANLWMYWMAEQGYLVFTVDNRGSEGRGAAFEKVIHRNLGVNEMDDQLKGVEYLKSLPYVDGNRLAVHGWSYGGFMTTSLMLRKPDVFKVGVAGGPVIDWKWYEIMYGERYMDTPAENQKGFDEAAVLNYAKDLKGKLLLIHGTGDDVVVEQHNLSLVKKFVEAGKQVDYFPYPMHKHNVLGKDRVHLMTKVLQYIIDNNK
ncbi:S9 family peptidase [Flavobacterium caeni]|uniref:Dipeptidyl-peptidase-4 n=1 Tax=Flavobacterium caeni TaxID=490189 RepID=A0A1G5HV21_9FLAO|nr:DPP IV N-terminal domain-containing protein [Flavobacterium caeni]SCY67577.1 dipeptidyl-peptidase-4 [Flavobacterium caeni]